MIAVQKLRRRQTNTHLEKHPSVLGV
jgi:hypothetical protein